MAGMREQYDTALLGILQHEGQISGFLDAMFGFLYRRTDFYRIMKQKTDRLGFPPGVAVKLLLNSYKQYEDLARKDEEEKEKLKGKKVPLEPTDTVPPAAVRTVEVSTSNQPVEEVNSELQRSVDSEQPSSASSSQATSQPIATEDLSRVENKPSGTKKQEEDPELTKQQQKFQANPASHNGAIRDNYSWSQTINDVDAQIRVPKYLTKGKDVKVVIERKRLKVSHKQDTGQWQAIVDDELSWEVMKEESMWSLVPGDHIHVNLEKKEERWWEALLTSESKINVRKIDASRPMTDLDDEAQAKIGEMMYNERQKKLGLPTSEENKAHKLLREAWDAEGSPFKGQPFDPSKMNVNPGGVISINEDKP
ncbi:nudC domain-containing protein 3-like isoform X2 [Pecten maximus]|uniref:nudC domain-containing protein 3-like isoform X2 n=1 Tax=Pecten maximus TaxID=6579 RepID=UPI001458DFDD|nr:nudC domain-containing protein 3-like isoform X2 [Pecten maximus]